MYRYFSNYITHVVTLACRVTNIKFRDDTLPEDTIFKLKCVFGYSYSLNASMLDSMMDKIHEIEGKYYKIIDFNVVDSVHASSMKIHIIECINLTLYFDLLPKDLLYVILSKFDMIDFDVFKSMLKLENIPWLLLIRYKSEYLYEVCKLLGSDWTTSDFSQVYKHIILDGITQLLGTDYYYNPGKCISIDEIILYHNFKFAYSTLKSYQYPLLYYQLILTALRYHKVYGFIDIMSLSNGEYDELIHHRYNRVLASERREESYSHEQALLHVFFLDISKLDFGDTDEIDYRELCNLDRSKKYYIFNIIMALIESPFIAVLKKDIFRKYRTI